MNLRSIVSTLPFCCQPSLGSAAGTTCGAKLCVFTSTTKTGHDCLARLLKDFDCTNEVLRAISAEDNDMKFSWRWTAFLWGS